MQTSLHVASAGNRDWATRTACETAACFRICSATGSTQIFSIVATMSNKSSSTSREETFTSITNGTGSIFTMKMAKLENKLCGNPKKRSWAHRKQCFTTCFLAKNRNLKTRQKLDKKKKIDCKCFETNRATTLNISRRNSYQT